MFFVDEPYVSEFFKKTVKDHDIPVVGTSIAEKLGLQRGTSVITEAEAIKMVKGSAW